MEVHVICMYQGGGFCPFLSQRIIEGIEPQCYDYSNISHVA